MERTTEPDGDASRSHPADTLYDLLLASSWEPALRTAFQLEHGAAGCKRRACVLSGACQVKWHEGKPIECGAGVQEEAIVTAAALVDFGALMVIRFLEDVVLPERLEALQNASIAASGKAAGKPRARRSRKLH